MTYYNDSIPYYTSFNNIWQGQYSGLNNSFGSYTSYPSFNSAFSYGTTPYQSTGITYPYDYSTTYSSTVNTEEQAGVTTGEEIPSPEDIEVSISRKDNRNLKKGQKDKLADDNKKAQGSLLGSLAFASLFMSGQIIKGAQVKKNAQATKLFTEYDNVAKCAKYKQLYKDAPQVMIDAQEEMAKASRQYEKALKKATKKGLDTTILKNDFSKLQDKMKIALNSGSADEVAKATEQLRAANKVKYRVFFKRAANGKGFTPTKSRIAGRADVSKVKVIKGNNFFRNCGGRIGIAMSLVAGIGMIACDYSKIKESKKYGKETQKKQMKQSAAKALIPTGAYLIGDGIGRTLVNKYLPKLATKLATRLATGGACKGIGAALGSFIPGLGTIVGLLIGTGLDFVLRKYVIPKCFGEIDAVDDKKIDKKKNKDLLKDICDKAINGEELTKLETKVVNENPTFCSSYIQKKQAEMQQAMEQSNPQNQVGLA